LNFDLNNKPKNFVVEFICYLKTQQNRRKHTAMSCVRYINILTQFVVQELRFPAPGANKHDCPQKSQLRIQFSFTFRSHVKWFDHAKK